MKLAEALQRRADLNREIDQLESRITSNMLVQDGENPNESPKDLFNDLDDKLAELEDLMTHINLTNAVVKVGDKTITELIAKRDTLSKKISVYKSAVYQASLNTSRARNTEIKILPTINVKSFQKVIDKMSRELRETDNLIQSTNWTCDLI
ncbi:MAG: DIP1984 family protein [Erysipelotrichaceae bacterium]|jgi:chromosome segregation ATPase|nr:DIP1984 family protein [Erysipelotrichaceae bacterium]